MSKNHIMVDLETLGTGQDAVIVAIGAVMFDPETGDLGDELYLNVSIDSNLEAGRKVSERTIQWWFSQSDEAQEMLFDPEPIPLGEALEALSDFARHSKRTIMWSHATFDAAILDNAYNSLGIKLGWRYKDVRDIRTIVDLASHLVEYGDVEFEGEKHNALDDARHQARYVSTRWQALKGLNETAN